MRSTWPPQGSHRGGLAPDLRIERLTLPTVPPLRLPGATGAPDTLLGRDRR